ncbi:MAG: deoxyribodipyrimidine photo-lyase [Geobacteraceae bacterium]|nr:deoxyribodipyrimidine photo-lyase [Geobacteraceae bacterium]
MVVNRKRIVSAWHGASTPGPVVYWMSRDQRADDNWALLHAQELALERKAPLGVVFCLVPQYLGATIRHYGFMLRGLEGVAGRLAGKGIRFSLLVGDPEKEIPRFIGEQGVSCLVADFNPLRVKQCWDRKVAEGITVPFEVVDAHNIVPCPVASSKREFGAHTFRPKIRKALPEFLTDFPPLREHPFPWKGKPEHIDWEHLRNGLRLDCSVGEISWLEPGERASRLALRDFLENRLASCYGTRNDPARNCQSNLSPYFHFGQLAPQRAALAAQRFDENFQALESFLEELIIRRELSDNFCLHTPDYDRFSCFPAWARETLELHRNDQRGYLYGREQLERSETHDPLWNAAQAEMVKYGKMHGYLRMYWAKKILEWTASPEQAMETAVYLNDRYELDGRDPNGYAGIAWSVGGVHDRPWPERLVYGKIRSMTYQGCKKKFDVDAYIRKVG